MNEDFILTIIIPCFNEQDNVVPIYNELLNHPRSLNYEILFVDDGSTDKTLENITALAEKNKRVRFISFSRNFGHQNALKAGYDHAQGDCVLTMDSDLQHPPSLIPQMLEKWKEGYEIVSTKRDDRKNIGLFKRFTSYIFHKLLNLFSDTPIERGAADFRLVDKKVVVELRKLNEHYLFLRGLVSWLGFKQCFIDYIPNKRHAGHTKYSVRKMFSYASAGITSFSTKPLKLSIFFGFIFAIIAFIYGIYALYEALFTENTITGWTSVIVSVLFIGGVQLVMIGILGEYLGKLFMENKRRPNYIIRESKL